MIGGVDSEERAAWCNAAGDGADSNGRKCGLVAGIDIVVRSMISCGVSQREALSERAMAHGSTHTVL